MVDLVSSVPFLLGFSSMPTAFILGHLTLNSLLLGSFTPIHPTSQCPLCFFKFTLCSYSDHKPTDAIQFMRANPWYRPEGFSVVQPPLSPFSSPAKFVPPSGSSPALKPQWDSYPELGFSTSSL